jgi:hypothetical protein
MKFDFFLVRIFALWGFFHQLLHMAFYFIYWSSLMKYGFLHDGSHKVSRIDHLKMCIKLQCLYINMIFFNLNRKPCWFYISCATMILYLCTPPQVEDSIIYEFKHVWMSSNKFKFLKYPIERRLTYKLNYWVVPGEPAVASPGRHQTAAR